MNLPVSSLEWLALKWSTTIFSSGLGDVLPKGLSSVSKNFTNHINCCLVCNMQCGKCGPGWLELCPVVPARTHPNSVSKATGASGAPVRSRTSTYTLTPKVYPAVQSLDQQEVSRGDESI